jgi:[protein-PII] uridylyltransferase
LLEVWEALDQAGYISQLLPEWDAVRFRPPQSALHRFTVDRHLLETCVEASKMVRDVRRPDLLLVAALVHDLGKAVEGDHSVTGAAIATTVARRLGFPEADVDTVASLVRQHLTLAQVATRRDLDDPMTVDLVTGIVGDTDTLDLLEALTYADARAAGPAAASPWRLRLVGELARRVRAELSGDGAGLWIEAPPIPVPELHQVVGVGRLGITVSEHRGDLRVNVAVPDQVGTLSTVAGVLALERLAVRAAVITSVDGLGISQWSVAGSAPDPVRLRDRLGVALRDDADLVRRLAARDSTARRGAKHQPSRVDLLPGASETATVLQVRAHDRPGLLYDVTRAIAMSGADIRSAHVSTLGAECVDVFYLTDSDGSPLEDEDALTTAKSVLDRLS